MRDLLQRHIEIRRQSNTDTVAPYLEALSAIRLGLTAPSVVEEAIPDAVGIAEGFAAYRSALADLGAVDFDEQIYQAIEILLTDADARVRAQSSCRHLLVDEFQDLNPAHLLLIRLLAAPSYDCFGVGDDDQVIYGYAGATPEFLIEFPRYFPGASGHALTVNYRCPPGLIDAARHVLSYNERRLDKEIHAPAGRTDELAQLARFEGPLKGSGPVAVLKTSADGLAGLAVDAISAWRSGGVDPGDIAVLTRVNSALLPVQVACMEAGVPCTTPLSAQRAAAHRHPHRLRLPAHRFRSGPHQAGGRPRDDPPPLPGHRPQGRRHAHQPTHHLDQRHPTTGRPPLGPRRAETRGLRRRPRDRRRGLRPFGGGGAQDHPARDRAGRHHGHPRRLAGRGRSLDPCR